MRATASPSTVVYDLPRISSVARSGFIFNDLQIAADGQFQTGQPFTVNSIFDVNLDGNLTDRLNSTAGIVETGDRRQPLRLTTNDFTALRAPIGQDGSIGRNTFRAGSILDMNLAVDQDRQVRRRPESRLPRRGLQLYQPRQLRHPRPLPRSSRLRSGDAAP